MNKQLTQRLPLFVQVIIADRPEVFRYFPLAYSAYLAFAFSTGAFFAWWDAGTTIFTRSLFELAALIIVSGVSSLGGLFVTLGYALTHFFGTSSWNYTSFLQLATFRPAYLHLYFVLFLWCVSVPLTARNIVGLIPRKGFGTIWFMRLRELLALGAGFFGGLFWSQAAPILLRPFYTWRGHIPPVDVIASFQRYGKMVGAIVTLAIGVRLVVDNLSMEASDLPVLEPRPPRELTWAGQILKVLIRVSVLTFFTAGIVESFWAFCIYFLGLFLVHLLGIAIGRIPKYVAILDGVPAILKIIVLFLGSYSVSFTIIRSAGTGSTFFPVILSIIANSGLALLLFPKLTRIARSQTPPEVTHGT